MKLNLMVFIQEIIFLKKDWAYVINLDEYESIETHWIVLNVNDQKNVIYSDSFEVENIPKEIKNFIGNKNAITNIFRIQSYDLIM